MGSCPSRAILPRKGEETMVLHYAEQICGRVWEREEQNDLCPVEKGRSGKSVELDCMMQNSQRIDKLCLKCYYTIAVGIFWF